MERLEGKETERDPVVVIGNGTLSGGDISVVYPSLDGLKQVTIPADNILAENRIEDGRMGMLVKHSEDFDLEIRFGGLKTPVIDDKDAITAANELELHANPEAVYPSLGYGGRNKKMTAWDFTPDIQPARILGPDGSSVIVNGPNGKPNLYIGFNPDLATAKQPHGHILGSYSNRYEMKSHKDILQPFLDRAKDNGWKANVTGYNGGRKARLDCDVSQAHGTIEATKQALGENKQHMFDMALTAETADNLSGLYRYGVTIENSLDGKGSLRTWATAMRMYCLNAAVFGGQQLLNSKRHTKGAIGGTNWERYADQVSDVIVAAQSALVDMEILKFVPIDVQMFEKLLTICHDGGLMPLPKVRKDVKQPEGVEVLGGHMWRVAMHGWTNHTERWVNVEPENTETLFHAYNILNGALTHRPSFTDGKKVYTGDSMDMPLFSNRLKKIDDIFRGSGLKIMGEYVKQADQLISSDNLDDLASFAHQKGSELIAVDTPRIGDLIVVEQ